MSATLYERVGGEPAVASLVDEFYRRVLADAELAIFFEGVSIEKLRRMQCEFFSAALDGPINYSGLSLSHAHHGRGITQRHFSLFVQHLFETLQSQEISQQDIDAVTARISTFVNDITGEVGEAG